MIDQPIKGKRFHAYPISSQTPPPYDGVNSTEWIESAFMVNDPLEILDKIAQGYFQPITTSRGNVAIDKYLLLDTVTKLSVIFDLSKFQESGAFEAFFSAASSSVLSKRRYIVAYRDSHLQPLIRPDLGLYDDITEWLNKFLAAVNQNSSSYDYMLEVENPWHQDLTKKSAERGDPCKGGLISVCSGLTVGNQSNNNKVAVVAILKYARSFGDVFALDSKQVRQIHIHDSATKKNMILEADETGNGKVFMFDKQIVVHDVMEFINQTNKVEDTTLHVG